MSETFDGDWLDLREPFDARARDPTLAMRLARALPARPRLLDLGAGTGALLRWLGHFIGRAQAWTLVDADAALIERAFETVAERAEQIGWRVSWPGRKTLLVHTPHGAWRVEALVADLAEAPDNLPLGAADAVVCSALCDLVSRDWVERMAAACAARRLPFYAALNVAGRSRFTPPHPADALVARGFRRDQARDKGFGGAALGPDAPGVLRAAFAARGYRVHTAPSDWILDPREREIADALAVGHARTAMAQERRGARRIAEWLAARRRLAEAGRLAVRVPHRDLLALPSPPLT
jgi:SAM-dependent methyltransferase